MLDEVVVPLAKTFSKLHDVLREAQSPLNFIS